MSEPAPTLSFQVEEIYNRAYYLFLAANSLRTMMNSPYMNDLQKQTAAKSPLEQLLIEGGGFVTFTQTTYDQHYVVEPEAFFVAPQDDEEMIQE